MESTGSTSRYSVTLTDKTWEAWIAQTKSNAMRYPDVSAMLQSNVEPTWTPRPFSVPMRDIGGEHQRTRGTEAFPDGELMYEIVQEWAVMGQFATDAYRNYLKDLQVRKTNFGKDLGSTFGDVRITTSQAIWDRMERMPEFSAKYEGQKLLFVITCARAASTGAGAHSVYIDFCHILKLEIVNDNWISFFKQYLALMVRIRGRGMTAEELLKAFFNSRFLVSVMESKLLKEQVDGAMSLPIWPDVDDLGEKWTNILTTRDATRGLERDRGVQGNEAEFDDGDYDDGREQHAYRARMDKFSKTLCDNWGEVGHIYPNCKKQPEICDECGDKHDTRFHYRVQERVR